MSACGRESSNASRCAFPSLCTGTGPACALRAVLPTQAHIPVTHPLPWGMEGPVGSENKISHLCHLSSTASDKYRAELLGCALVSRLFQLGRLRKTLHRGGGGAHEGAGWGAAASGTPLLPPGEVTGLRGGRVRTAQGPVYLRGHWRLLSPRTLSLLSGVARAIFKITSRIKGGC